MKKIIILLLCMGTLLFTTGCSETTETTEATESIETIKSTMSITQENVSSYGYSGEITFVPVSYQNIDDGTNNGLDILQYVNLDTGVMYVYTEKYKSGYGITWCELKNPDGTLMIYEDLETLRLQYRWDGEQ